MSGAFNSPIHKRKPAINVAPLIDVMFLLLIFFMVSATFRENFVIDIVLPQAETGLRQELAPHEIAVDRGGASYFDGDPVTEMELREAILRVIEAEPGATLVLRADDQADFGRVLRVIDIARDLKAANLIIPTAPLEGVNQRDR